MLLQSGSGRKVERKKTSPFKSRAEFGAGASLTSFPGLSSTEEDEFSLESWAADDPLAAVESRTRFLSTAGTAAAVEPQISFANLMEVHAAWRALAMDPALSSTFFTQPIETFKTGSPRFTPTQIKNLQAAGLPRLIDVLETYPRGYTASTAGRLPDPGLVGEEQLVSLAVTLEKVNVVIPRTSDYAALTAI